MKSFMKKSRRAFTIVELVIVIAVIAILAAVLIPTFASVISSANESSDIQATKNMNTALYSEEILNGKPSNLSEAKEVLDEAGYSDNLYPATNNYHWYWNSYYNIVMLIDDTDGWELIYPQTDDAGNAYTQYLSYCYNINNSLTAPQQLLIDEVAKASSSNKVSLTITSPGASSESNVANIKSSVGWEDLVVLSNKYGEDFENVEIMLSDSLSITEVNPIHEFKGTFDGNSKTITLSANAITPVHGTSGNGYLYSSLYSSEDGLTKYKYGYGLFAAVVGGGVVKNLTVTYSDVFAPAEPGNEYTYFGGIAGFLGEDSTISGCTVTGNIIQYNRVGGIVGTAFSGTIENCKVEANITSVAVTDSTYKKDGTVAHSDLAEYSYVAGIVAYAGNAAPNTNTLNITGCTVGSSSTAYTITGERYVGGICARITSGIEKFNISGTTMQNVTLKAASTASRYIGAVSGSMYVPALYGGITLKDITITNRSSESNLCWYMTTSDSSLTKSSSSTLNVNGALIVIGYYDNTNAGTYDLTTSSTFSVAYTTSGS